MCKIWNDNGIIVITAASGSTLKKLDKIIEMFEKNYIEVYVNCSIENV